MDIQDLRSIISKDRAVNVKDNPVGVEKRDTSSYEGDLKFFVAVSDLFAVCQAEIIFVNKLIFFLF